jgi:disulfide bond formation protein DsbB
MTTPTTSLGEGRWPALTWLAFLVSIVTVAGSLYLSLGQGLVACPLCFYQRAFAMAACAVLAVGLLSGMGRDVPLSLLAIPAAMAGLVVSGFHVHLEATGKLECPAGIQAIGSAPQQAFVALALLVAALLLDAVSRLEIVVPRFGTISYILGVVLGATAAFGCIISAPAPKPRDKPYDAEKEPLNICRPPYVAPQ